MTNLIKILQEQKDFSETEIMIATYLLANFRKLAAYLQDPDVQYILKENGYEDLSLGGILRTFQCRYETYMNHGEGFPHEIGLLLGYPIEDVTGFVEQKGKNYLYSGYWKVYRDVAAKKRIFAQYAKSASGICH